MTRRRDPRIFLLEAERAAAQIESFAGDMARAAFLDDEMTRLAVERSFEMLGLALGRLARHCPELAARVPHAAELAEYGEQLVREPSRVAAAEVWRRARNDAPEVRRAARALLDELDREAGKAKARQTASM